MDKIDNLYRKAYKKVHKLLCWTETRIIGGFTGTAGTVFVKIHQNRAPTKSPHKSARKGKAP
ncbi:MAG: hypothetical protein RR049_05825, partial [Angelakisella sp.]